MADQNSGSELEPQAKEEITEENQKLDTSGELTEKAGQVDVGNEAKRTLSREEVFPQTVPSIEQQKPPTSNITTEAISQKPDIFAASVSEADVVSDLETDIQKIKSSNDDKLGVQLSKTTEKLVESRKRLVESRKRLAGSGKEIAELSKRLNENSK